MSTIASLFATAEELLLFGFALGFSEAVPGGGGGTTLFALLLVFEAEAAIAF